MLLGIPRLLHRLIDDVVGAVDLRPSDYWWILPASDQMPISKLDRLASTGDFPSLAGLSDSLLYCLLFSLIRFILQHLLLKVINSFATA